MSLLKSLTFIAALAFAGLVAAAGPVDINRADAATLVQLNGIGPAKAEAIVAWREANGPFLQVEDLAKVRGIGLRLVEQLRADITVSPEPVAAATPAQR
ncbi:MAG: ComEA family DNA-binding protein [Xanthomonadales bacterium]|nr:ComEA family DNA-binding protein [Xanthomonadales bacterium]